ncbi:Teichoic acid translocation permease protein TagG [Sporotomaculum syntrophicum]|uniref:Transport permease protein n=1 Tax=Sporotomaculum syntrophicum TaxID=182264 RepID=A0A9D2WRE0_9FIRM|nr:ABC transporter permease [Sporotomaculum syntrophicum]KAF1086049.1 Teichoic acid translocation permease protein TagG [Sporotomaculum syntrophicum]
MKNMLIALWQYRHFIKSSIRGELKARVARSRLGTLWFVLHPLAQATIFALVLAEVLGAKLPNIENKAAYPIYLMSGMAAWGLFSDILNRCLNIFVEYSSTLKKISFPRLCLPMIVWGSALINHILLLLAIVVVFLFFGHTPRVTWFVIPLGILLISLFAFGMGVMLGIFNVFTRDVGQVIGVVMQIWFWLTPIVYPYEIIPQNLRWLAEINLMVPLVRIYQDALLYNQWPDFTTLWLPAVVAMSLFMFSFVLFRKAGPELVDVL